MPVLPGISLSGQLLWALVLVVVAGGVSELVATVARVSRPVYIAVLTAVTAALSAGYLAATDADVGSVLGRHWVAGLLAAPVVASPLMVGMTRQPVVRRRHGRPLTVALLWEGGVYGTAEGVLLSVLPGLVGWQLAHELDWTGAPATTARWAVPLLLSLLVITVHHLGYPEYRNAMLVPIGIGCGLLTLGYLVTGSVLAAVAGHVLGHAVGLTHGAELPPHARGSRAPDAVRVPATSSR